MELKLILTDIDECVLRYHETFESWVRKNPRLLDILAIPMPKASSHLHLKQDMEEWFGITHDRVSILIDIFSRSEQFRDIPPGWESETYIPRLHGMGYQFIAITSAGGSDIVKESRTRNIEKYFPKMFLAVHCLPWTESKEDILKIYRKSWWVEDRVHNAELGLKYCHKPFIITNTHNLGDLPQGIKRAKSWKQIYECVTSDECNLLGWMC